MPGTGGGEVTLKFYKGNVMVIGRSSPKSLYSSKIVTFEDDAGFIKLNDQLAPARQTPPR
jgi:argininosuccinate synthase